MQQQRHALEIPEILSLVGSFLPLWEHTSPQYSENGTFVFNPNPLCTCLQVSKLWNRTLLRILWHGYWYESMIRVPDEIIRRHSHLFMTLHLSEWAHLSHDISLFNCTNLIDLSISTCDDRRNTEGGAEGGGGLRGSKDSRKQRGVNILHAKRLLRSNPKLQGLSWRRFGGKGKALDVEDFVTLSGLERLTLENWNSSGGQLVDVLRIAAGSLQEIKLDCIDGVLPEQLSAPVTSTLTQEEYGTVKGTELVHGDGGLVLARLELLEVGEIGFSGGVDEFLAELVKRCPRLKTFRTFSLFKNFGVDHLATCVGNHCPNIESLELLGVLETYKVETLIRHCSPNEPQLRTLHLVIHNLTDGQGLVSAILQHATTLEDLWICSTHPNHMDGSHCLELLVGCARLSRFAYLTEEALDLDFLEAMKQERWGCQGTLRELKFREGCKGFSTRQTNAEIREAMSLLSKTGWEEVRDDIEDDGEHSSGNDDSQNDPMMLRKALELVRCQQLEALKVLIVGLQTFQRI